VISEESRVERTVSRPNPPLGTSHGRMPFLRQSGLMSFSTRVMLGLAAGAAAGIFLGELVEPLGLVANAFVRLLQMSVLPYVTLSIVTNLGSLTAREARSIGIGAATSIGALSATALCFAFLFPATFPEIETASFFSPSLGERAATLDLIELYIPANPFYSLANSVVPAVVLFSILFGLALMGVPNKQPLLEALRGATSAVGRLAQYVVRLTPFGIFAIAAHAAGTLNPQELARINVYLFSYLVFSLLLSLWVLPGLISALTPIGAIETLQATRDALLTAFLVGDLFIVLPSLMDSCSALIGSRFEGRPRDRDLPGTIVPVSFTFPHSGKLLSISFVLFAGWFSNSAVSPLRYPELALSGFLSFFGSLSVAIPFLLDLNRIPADTFQLFLATGVVNARFGSLLAAVHTVAVCLIGSAAIAGQIRFQPVRIARFLGVTLALSGVAILGLRLSFARFLDLEVNGRELVYNMHAEASAPDEEVIGPEDVPEASIPEPEAILAGIRQRGMLRVGIIGDGIPYAFRDSADTLIGFDVEMAFRLASDLGVGVQFVRFPQEQLVEQVQTRRVDIVMTGARLTPERAAAFVVAEPYLDETLAVLTLDYNRGRFQSWAAIRELGPIRVAVQNLPYYVEAVRSLLPEARLEIIEETKELLDPEAPYDLYLLPAERGSVLTMLNPRFAVVIPEGVRVRMPLAYPVAGSDPSWIRFVNTWIGLKKRDGTVDGLYDRWILGKAAEREEKRWSIVRDVLHWVD